MAGRRFVEHHVKHAERIVDDGEAVVVDDKQPILVAVDQNLQDLDQRVPRRPAVKD